MARPNLNTSCQLTLVGLLVALRLVAVTAAAAASPAPRSARQQANSTSELCLSRASELDKCLPKLIVYGYRQFEPPRSEAQLDRHCSMLDDNLKCVSSYSRECLPPFARNLYSVVTRRLKVQFARRCKSREGRQDFLNLMACADLKHMEPAHKCMDSFISHLEHIGQGRQNRQIELTCCTFQLFQECIFRVSRQMECSERRVTAEKSIEYVRSIINSMGGDMMELMCGRYESVKACQTGYPKLMDQFASQTSSVFNGTLRPRASSPLRPMLQLFIDSQQALED